MMLISRNLVVGNEITVEPDGSFTMRVLPAALDRLSENPDIAELRAHEGSLR